MLLVGLVLSLVLFSVSASRMRETYRNLVVKLF